MNSQLSTHQSPSSVPELSEDECTKHIKRVLNLNDSVDSKIIVKQLQINGRQYLRTHQNNLSKDIIKEQVTSDQSELLDILKTYFEKKWQQTIGEEWFKDFLIQQKNDSPDFYSDFLKRVADDYSKYIKKDNEILSLTIQLLFKFNDESIAEDLFNQIWNKLISEGRQGIKHYQEYIPENMFNNQLNDNRSPLFLALKNYYHLSLKTLVENKKINISDEVFKKVLDFVANYGRCPDVHNKQVVSLIAATYFKNLEELKQYLDGKQLSVLVGLPLPTNEKQTSIETSKSPDGILIRINFQLFLLFL